MKKIEGYGRREAGKAPLYRYSKRYEEEFYEMMLSSELIEELITGKRNVLELVVKL
ncbi:MAG TPA: hypothetical protein PLY38_01190 [Candidatus Hydrothermia bacterium]|nr:hypothetical protein [Candidatus Hydrothermae bacterium]MDD3648774.1 hypothetical protein [Candidatus Hydrothermia bacterium]MDD5572895.1 hypothetical protein [Candidatus Hydrothermia bacterium]HOK23279.1 hypothetical protein [Candidatus Hydrothermia bacterium]HOL24088.1 hypothetical protein [Candidatus Hydrothermia bacterium]